MHTDGLTPTDESSGAHHDIAVVGSGAAGLMAACAATERGARVVVLTDRGVGTSNSAVAQGGLQLPVDDPAALERFADDVARSAGPAVDPARIDHFVRSVRPTIELLRSWGLELDRDANGELVRRSAGGLSEPRIVTADDRIGTAILRVLRRRAGELGIEVRPRCRIVDVEAGPGGIGLRAEDGARWRFDAVVVAVGGRAFEHARAHDHPTSNPANRNSTLYGAVRALGIAEIDPDRFQFQPYGIVLPDGERTERCVPESVVELGARVVDRTGVPLAPAGADRRVLTEAMFDAVRSGSSERADDGSPVLRLTVGDLDRDELLRRYPHLDRIYARAALPSGDVFVEPVVHYQLGGFVVAPDCSTTVPGLFLAGEMTGGLHGRNRLMGNGITEAVVDGFVAGSGAATLVSSAR